MFLQYPTGKSGQKFLNGRPQSTRKLRIGHARLPSHFTIIPHHPEHLSQIPIYLRVVKDDISPHPSLVRPKLCFQLPVNMQGVDKEKIEFMGQDDLA